MNRTFIPLFTFTTGLLVSFACGTSEQNYRKVALNSADALPIQPVDFSFSLPARSNLGLDSSVLQQKMTGYAWRIEGQGDKCADSQVHESYGPYQDSRIFAMQLSSTCNYLVKIMVGALAEAPAALELTGTINYTDHIKPIITSQCLSCHADYKDFAVVDKIAKTIVTQVENQTMPPSGGLDGSQIALFLAWGDAGFLEKDPNPTVPTAADQSLSAIYYRNNANDKIMDYELLGRSSFELRRSLWIQPEGQALGLSHEQIFTFKTSSP